MLNDKTEADEQMGVPDGDENRGSERATTVFVNGRAKIVSTDHLSYTEVVRLAFADAVFNENTVYTVTYKRGHGSKPQGSMVDGDNVKVHEGMHFNVTRTDKS